MTFTDDERALLSRFFTNTDQPVFGLVNLPEVVKGALFARYSRSAKSLRRLFLDEFAEDVQGAWAPIDELGVGLDHAEGLYQRVFSEYGDDSVAQLGGAHVAIEGVSNLMTKQIEWHRLAAYLEQSTRYIDAYAQRDGDGRFRYHRDQDVMAGPHGDTYERELDAIFEVYAALYPQILDWVRGTYPQDEATSDFAYRNATKAKALDLLRGLLPAATTSNVGMFASGQSYEGLLLRLRSLDLAEAQDVAARLLVELRKIVPSFLTRVDREDRGVVWSQYLQRTRAETRVLADELISGHEPEDADLVSLVDWWPRDPQDADVELVTAALYAHVDLPEHQLREVAAKLSADERARVVAAYVGERSNRRHKPGRGFERVQYRFDVLADYGGFRDLQRHRMLTIEWQDLTTRHGFEVPRELEDVGVDGAFVEALERSAHLHELLHDTRPMQSQYAVCFAYRVRYTMQMNARAAMQMLELRSTPQGHPQYRRVVQEMHRLIRERAGHTLIADAMRYVDHGAAELERLESERAAEARRSRGAPSD
ncbi:MAG TPA: FAD-dependent thymidylate synthase [Nitriliruptorales bacterium]